MEVSNEKMGQPHLWMAPVVQWGAIKISPLLIWTRLGSLGDNLIRWPFEPFMSSEPNQKQAMDLSPYHNEPFYRKSFKG